MKKVMIVLAAVVAGVAAHAATVDWSMTVTGSAVDYSASNYNVYLVDAAKWDALASVTADTFSNSEIVYGQTTFAAGSGKGTSKTYVTKNSLGNKGSYALNLSDSVVAKDGTLDVYYVIVDSSSDPSKYYASDKATLTGRLATGTEIQTGFASVANSAVSWTATQSAAVPEPTSGILMLLGLSGLALKRRRA